MGRKRSEKAFDGMRGDHVFLTRFDGGCVTWVFGQDVKMREMATRAVEEEIKNLLEQFIDRRALRALAHGTEKAVDVREYVNASQVASKEVEPGATG